MARYAGGGVVSLLLPGSGTTRLAIVGGPLVRKDTPLLLLRQTVNLPTTKDLRLILGAGDKNFSIFYYPIQPPRDFCSSGQVGSTEGGTSVEMPGCRLATWSYEWSPRLVHGMASESRTEEFLLLYSECEGWLFGYLMAMLGNREDAEEVFQETTLALWRSFDTFVPGTDFTRWVKRTAFHRVLTHRKQKRRLAIPHSEEFLVAVHAADQRQGVSVNVRLKQLDDCVGRLTEADRELISLRYNDKRTIPELASLLGKSDSTITKALSRIRRALMMCIDRGLRPEGRS